MIKTKLRLKPNGPKTAAIEFVKRTLRMGEYPDRQNPILTYSKCPGFETLHFPRNQYFERIENLSENKVSIEQYDFFLTVSADRFIVEESSKNETNCYDHVNL